MAIKFSELRGLLKDTSVNTVKMSDPAYNAQLAKCRGNDWTRINTYVTIVNFSNLNKLKLMNRLDVTCLFCPSEINLWISTNDKYQYYENGTDAYLFLKRGDLYNLDTTLNKIIPKINKKPLLSLFYVMNPINGGALSADEGTEKFFRGAKIMNYHHYFNTQLSFNNISQVQIDSQTSAELIIKIKPEIIKRKGAYNVLIGLGYKPDDDFSYSDVCDLSFWADYASDKTGANMFSEDSFSLKTVHRNYRYGIENYFENFDSRVIY